MDDPLLVSGVERVRNLPCDRDGLRNGHRAGEDRVGERVALDQLERQGANAVVLFDPMDRR